MTANRRVRSLRATVPHAQIAATPTGDLLVAGEFAFKIDIGSLEATTAVAANGSARH